MKDFTSIPLWELKAMAKARTFLAALNTPKEERELKAIRAEIRRRNKVAKEAKKKA